ncbi:MAG TPA: hypothetical protein PLU22_04760, partial [Polyangiaceae bacterium]|nr:hypothetical protein [Polyangiaceae bacterium]
GSFGGGTSGGGAAGGTTPVGAGGEVASSDGGAPAACVLTYSSLAPRHCYSELDCPEGPTRVRCNGSSPASCECHVADVRTDFVVNGPAADPCALVARSCVETPADDLPPPLCEPFEAEAYADSCWVDSRCTRAVALDGGVTLARVSSHDRASCDLVEGRWECRCELPTGDVELDLPDAASSTAICDEAIRRCFHDELTVVAGRTCMSDFVEASDAACQTWVNCTTSLSAGGIDAELVQWSLLQCSLEDGVLDCLCEASYAHGPMTVPGGDPWSDCPALAERCIADLLPLP